VVVFDKDIQKIPHHAVVQCPVMKITDDAGSHTAHCDLRHSPLHAAEKKNPNGRERRDAGNTDQKPSLPLCDTERGAGIFTQNKLEETIDNDIFFIGDRR